jgi:hypothetical protein
VTIIEGVLKRSIVYTIALCRLCILVLIFTLKLLETDVYNLLYITLPLTTLYFIFFFKFIYINNRYLCPGRTISKSYFITQLLIPLTLLLVQIVLISFNVEIFVASIKPLFPVLISTECLLAAYTGFYLSDIFAKKMYI